MVAASIYAFGLMAMLGCSAAYSLGGGLRCRELLRRLDHAAIFVMIAGTYTPFTVLALHGALAVTLTAAVWAIAAIGIALKLLGLGIRPVVLWTGLYVAFGWIGVLAAEPFLATLTSPRPGAAGGGRPDLHGRHRLLRPPAHALPARRLARLRAGGGNRAFLGRFRHDGRVRLSRTAPAENLRP